MNRPMYVSCAIAHLYSIFFLFVYIAFAYRISEILSIKAYETFRSKKITEALQMNNKVLID